MQYVKPAITTIAVGIAMSTGALLLAGGAPGKRLALPNAKMLIHQLWGGFEGEASEIEIQAQETIALKRRIEELSKAQRAAARKVARDIEREHFINVEEAVVYGIIDRVLTHRGQQSERSGNAFASRRRKTTRGGVKPLKRLIAVPVGRAAGPDESTSDTGKGWPR
jgi:ATP-dependent protease ClpP protease subunit